MRGDSQEYGWGGDKRDNGVNRGVGIPVVALTFDDGHSQETERILDLLAEYGAKATFFVVGKNVEQHPELRRRIVEEGHAIGIHSYDHRFMLFMFSRTVRDVTYRTQRIIYDVTGVNTTLYRAPWGVPSPFVPKEFSIYYWSKNGKDYKHTSAEDVLQELDAVKTGDSILLHDGGGITRVHVSEALEELLRLRFLSVALCSSF